MKTVALRRINQFHPEDDDKLGRELSSFEDAVDSALTATQGNFAPKLAPTNAKTAAYTAKLDELVLVDTSATAQTVVLPIAKPQNAGRAVGIAPTSSAHAVTLSVVSGKINQGTTLALAAATRLFLAISDGSNWWSTV